MPISYHDMRDDNAFKNAYQIPSHFQLNIFGHIFLAFLLLNRHVALCSKCLVQTILATSKNCILNWKLWFSTALTWIAFSTKKITTTGTSLRTAFELFPQLMENCHAKPKSKKNMHQFVLFGSPSNGVRKTFPFILSLKFQTNFNEKVGMWENTSMFFWTDNTFNLMAHSNDRIEILIYHWYNFM